MSINALLDPRIGLETFKVHYMHAQVKRVLY
jgi:hypothetical protein